jgi:hypothetical protein
MGLFKSIGSVYGQLEWAHTRKTIGNILSSCIGPILDYRQHFWVAAMVQFKTMGSIFQHI